MITVKSDNSIKIALDSKELNEAIHKNKYQIQSIDHLMDTISKKISEQKNNPGTFYFSKIDLKYAYSQIPLHKDTQNTATLISWAETPQEQTDSSMAFKDSLTCLHYFKKRSTIH